MLERTRISHIWIDNQYIGSNNSLCSSHRYCLTPYIKNKHRLTIMIDNTSYLVKGGHMTSPDTQTNWNGITGEIYIEECEKSYLSGIKIYSSPENKQIEVKVILNGEHSCILTAIVSDDKNSFCELEYPLYKGENSIIYQLDESAQTWSEHTPNLYNLHLKLKENNGIDLGEYNLTFGLRGFKASGKYFLINGDRTFLRGKHEGMIFPLTAYAPTDVESWIKILKTAKEYGINHYRFHTCCPPEACFEAADRLGIYLEPELPFWGTVTQEGDNNHDGAAQQYLIEEGFRILDEFGNHPSFVMMSLGNELWGSQKVLNQIIKEYKQHDARHLYTQGSNNFQFMPTILEEEDFYCGVRLSKDRLFRGSYAMCDAPQGHIQTQAPGLCHDNEIIIAEVITLEKEYCCGVFKLHDFNIQLPENSTPKKLKLKIRIDEHDIENNYDIWIYPKEATKDTFKRSPKNDSKDIIITSDFKKASEGLEQGSKVLFYPENLDDKNSIEGTYCTDFWCYPMFRSISENMGKPEPIGTLGLFIDNKHPMFKSFPTEYYTAPQWYDIVSSSRALIIDETVIEPVVWTIDNFERSHKLGNIFELTVGRGKLLVCTSILSKLEHSYPGKWLEYSMTRYIESKDFNPKIEMSIAQLNNIFGVS